MIRAVIFDLDGTLIDSSKGVVEAVNYALRETGNDERPPAAIKPWSTNRSRPSCRARAQPGETRQIDLHEVDL